MYSAARVEAGIYHCLITFYKWICGYLHRGSVTATLDMKSWLFRCRYSRSRLSERPSALQQLAVLTANAAEGITSRQGEALLEYLWWIPEWELTLRLFFSERFFFFRYLMHKWCNSDCYLSPSQRCLSLLSHTISSLLILTLNWSAKLCCSQQVPHSEQSFTLFKGSQAVWIQFPNQISISEKFCNNCKDNI